MKFIEILEEFNIPIAPQGHHHQTEGYVQIDCPFCGKDSQRFHMGYNTNGGYINCWKCGGHSLVSVLQELTGMPYHKIRQIIEQLDEISRPLPRKERLSKHVSFPPYLCKLKNVHIKYLQSRGFNYKNIEQLWKIKGIGIAGRLSWRIFIPINYQGHTVSWTTRAVGKNVKKRYISAKPEQEMIPHKDILYGIDYARRSVIVTEGPLDVWAIGPGAVSTFGTSFTQKQILLLCKFPHRIVCFDNNTEAQKQAQKLCNALSSFDGETLNVVLDEKDPADSKPLEIKKLRKFLE